eukprot:3149106-Ditylum_brightwellii.AAC.1
MMVHFSSKFYAVGTPTKVNNTLKTDTTPSNIQILKLSGSPVLSPDASEPKNMLISFKNETEFAAMFSTNEAATSSFKPVADSTMNIEVPGIDWFKTLTILQAKQDALLQQIAGSTRAVELAYISQENSR